MRNWCVGAIVMAMLVAPALAACPNKCSGHGRCGKSDVCECMQNWTGGDCSGRVCPFTRAWHDTPEGDDDGHYYAECGNRGLCDREKGLCECDEPFAGSGCRRMGCPADCSGHGVCDFIDELAGNGYNKRIGGAWGRKYTLWDQEKIMGCRCDAGFEGYNCAKRVCPKGDDPLTEVGTEMYQVIHISDITTLYGFLTYHDPYGNAWTTEAINFGATGSTCSNIESALGRLPNNVLNSVKVTSVTNYGLVTRPVPTDAAASWAAPSTTAAGLVVYCEVKFTAEPGTTGYQNLLECDISKHNSPGQHPMTAGPPGVTTPTCNVYESTGSAILPVSTAGSTRPLNELAECSNRGTCDYTTGQCKCFAGHMGLACQTQEALV